MQTGPQPDSQTPLPVKGEDTGADSLVALRRDLVAAGLLQQRMFPDQPLSHDRFQIRYHIAPASELCGDFVGLERRSDSTLVFLVADVAGHGAAAALVTVALKSFMSRLAVTAGEGPAQLLWRLNNELIALDMERHVCALCGTLTRDSGQVHIAGAGAFPRPLLSRGADAFAASPLDTKGKALGLFEGERYDDQQLVMHAGDRLTVVTDGVLDLLDGDSLVEKERRLERIAATNHQPDFATLLQERGKESQVDDVTWFEMDCLT